MEGDCLGQVREVSSNKLSGIGENGTFREKCYSIPRHLPHEKNIFCSVKFVTHESFQLCGKKQ